MFFCFFLGGGGQTNLEKQIVKTIPLKFLWNKEKELNWNKEKELNFFPNCFLRGVVRGGSGGQTKFIFYLIIPL